MKKEKTQSEKLDEITVAVESLITERDTLRSQIDKACELLELHVSNMSYASNVSTRNVEKALAILKKDN